MPSKPRHQMTTTRMPAVRAPILPPPMPSSAPDTECAHAEVEVITREGETETREVINRFDASWFDAAAENELPMAQVKSFVHFDGLCTYCGVEVHS